MWPRVRTFRFGVGRSGGCADLQAIGHRMAAGARVAHARDAKERVSKQPCIPAPPWRQDKSAKPTRLLERPLPLSGPVVRGRGLGGPGLAQPPTLSGGRSSNSCLPEGVYAAWARLGWPQAALSDGDGSVMNLGLPTHRGPAPRSAVEGTC